MRARLNSLSSALETQRKTPSTPSSSGFSAPTGMGGAVSLGFRVMSEFVAAVVVAAVIGWGIDRVLGSSPIGLIIFIVLGTAAGFWNVYRIAAGTTASKDAGKVR